MTSETIHSSRGVQGLDSISTIDVTEGRGLWSDAWFRLKKDRMALACLFVIGVYALIAFLCQMNWLASSWDKIVGAPYQAPSWGKPELWLGTDIFGRSVFYKVLQGTRVAMSVGLISSMISIPIG